MKITNEELIGIKSEITDKIQEVVKTMTLYKKEIALIRFFYSMSFLALSLSVYAIVKIIIGD